VNYSDFKMLVTLDPFVFEWSKELTSSSSWSI